jgi:putative two-component system response regulator
MIGANILHSAVMQLEGGGFLSMASMIAQSHHERWDGKGYQAELVGDEIPLAARIVSVADVFDALTSWRPYKEAWSPDRAKYTIDEGAGTQFDPVVVAAFDRCFDDLARIQSSYADENNQTLVGAMSFQEYNVLEAC